MARRKRQPLLRRWLSARGRSLEITRAGWLFILLTLAVGFAAINSGSNLLHAVFGAQMALILGSGILSEATVRRTVARRVPVGEVYACEPAPVRVELGNVDRRIDVLSVSVEDDDRSEHQGRCAPVFAVRLAAGGALALPTTVTMDRRGRHELPPAVVATRFPFGLFVKRRELPSAAPVIVYPRVRDVVVPQDDSPHSGTGEAPRRRARVGEFFGLREFRDGDDLRRVHWPAYARVGRPFVREHEADGDREVVLHLALGRTGDAGFEADVEHCASQAVALLREGGVAVGLRIGGELVVPPAAGDEQRRRLLGTLAVCGQPARTNEAKESRA